MKKLDEPHNHVVRLKIGGSMCVIRQHFEVEPEDVGLSYPFFCGGGYESSSTIRVGDIGRKVSFDLVDALHHDWRYVNSQPE